MGLAHAVKETHVAQPQFPKKRSINKRAMLPFAQTLFAATRAIGLLLQILGHLLLDKVTLH